MSQIVLPILFFLAFGLFLADHVWPGTVVICCIAALFGIEAWVSRDEP